MNKADEYLLNDLIRLYREGTLDANPRPKYKDGEPAYTLGVNHVIRTYDLTHEFPITSARKMAWKTAIKEIFWIYQDQTSDLSTLENKYNNHVWNDWNIGNGTIGQRYGATVKKYDLMNKLLYGLKNNPFGRRHIIDLYQYTDLNETDGLEPCAFLTIWNVRKEDHLYLDMTLVQRSGDMLVASGAGGFNEIQYAALQLMVAKHCGYKPGIFTHFIANEHIYNRHDKNANQMFDTLMGMKNDTHSTSPMIRLETDKTNFYTFDIEDFKIYNYEPYIRDMKFEIGI